MFQGLGNTRPALISSLVRIGVFVPLALFIRYQPDFTINQVWYVSILSVTIQAICSFLLVRREFRLKLNKTTEELAEGSSDSETPMQG